jgi:heme-degrading monooxygenase HmoA
MLVAIFRSRLRPNLGEDYQTCNKRMKEILGSLPGFISCKGFTASDGERVSIVEWDSPEHFRAWVEHPEHLEAKERGRQDYYEDYTCYICDDPKVYGFSRDSG